MPEEPRYTLEEAARLLARQECDEHGHDLDQTLIRDATGTVHAVVVACARCRATFTEDPRG